MTNVAMYTRISLDRFEESESTERQEMVCRRLATERGWTISEVFCDRDVSAWKVDLPDRPAGARMLAGVDAGRFDVVLFWKLDRLARRYFGGIKIVARIMEGGAQAVSATETIDTSTPIGQAIVGFVLAQAEQESRNTSLRVSSAWASKAARGEAHPGGRRCFGYTAQRQPNPDEWPAAADAIQRVLAGESLRGVARWLNESGHPTTAGQAWTHTTLKQWLQAPTLAGIRSHRVGGKGLVTETAGSWEPLLQPDERDRLLGRIGSLRPGRPGGQPRLLAGLAHCSACAAPMYAKRAAYTCSSDKCGKVSIQVEGADAEVKERVLTFLSATELRPTGDQDPAVLAQAVADDQAALADVNRRRFVTRELPESEWHPLRDDLVSRIEAGKATITAWERSAAATGLRPGNRDDLEAWWAEATVPERREALKRVVDSVVVLPALRGRNRFDKRRLGVQFNLEAFAQSEVEDIAIDEAGFTYMVEIRAREG
jgi:DNA invertase Pin-like site-specific DNA recombinase